MRVYLYIAAMALTTYLIRMIPMTFVRRKIKNRFLRSFLFYIPSACLTAMTFPAMVFATGSVISGAISFAVAVFLAYRGKSLVTVAACSCISVFLVELIVKLL